MKLLSCLFVIILFAFLPYQNSIAQWKQTSGPTGGRIWTITTDGTNLYAGTTRGTFRSTDNGANWKFVSKESSISNTTSLSIVGDYIFAGSYKGLFRSGNKGEGWLFVNNGITDNSVVTSVVSVGNCLFAGTGSNGVFISTDNAYNWTAVNNGLKSSYSRRINKLITIDTVVFAATNSGIFRSANYGASWDSISNGINYWYAASSLTALGSTLIAACERSIWISEDYGFHWKAIEGDINKYKVTALETYNNKIYAGTDGGGVFVSSDSGLTWKNISSSLSQLLINDITVNNNGIFLGTWSRGVFSSTDNGASWQAENKGLIFSEVNSLLTQGKDIYAGTSSGEVFLSTDNGASWTSRSNGLPQAGYINIVALASCGENLLAGINIPSGGGNSKDGGIYLSTDKGESWKQVNNGLVSTSIEAIAVKGTDIFTATSKGISHSDNYGASWETLNNGLTDTAIRSLLINGNDIYANSYHWLFISTDNGAVWKNITNDLNEDRCLGIAAIDSNVFVSYLSGASFVYKTTNRGLNWKAINTNINGFEYFAVYGKSLFAATPSNIFLSPNLGESWKSVQEGLTNVYISSLAISDNYLYTGTTYNGVYVRKLTDMITSVSDNNPLPESFSLKQNYPNPFNPTTTISYSIPKQSYIELKVYDMLGREVSILVNKEQSAGEYNVMFDGTSLPSGVYIYALQAGQFRESKKLLLLK